MPKEYYPLMWQTLELSITQILKPESNLSDKALTSLFKAFNAVNNIEKELQQKLW